MRYTLYCIIAFILFSACGKKDHIIRIKGSDTEVNLSVELAESFHSIQPDFNVSISGGGTGLGIAALLNGLTDIANASRELTPEEDSIFKARNIAIDTFVFAEDAIAFIVPVSSPLDSITVQQLTNLLNGNTDNWSQLTGINMPVNIYGRQSNSGTQGFIRNKLGISFSPYAKEMNGNAQIIEAVKRDNSGIGYVGAGYLQPHNFSDMLPVKVLKIKPDSANPAVSPLDETAIAAKQYFFQRPLYQYISKSSATKVAPFIAFEKSAAGIAIIRKSGYYINHNSSGNAITAKGNN